jgi:hypothetical protein
MAFEWVSSGSCQDLSDMPLARNSMWPTSQSAGNRQAKPDMAMTAPGSDPVDRELKDSDMADPHVDVGKPIHTGTSGKPQAARTAGAPHPAPPAWTRTTTPAVVRELL